MQEKNTEIDAQFWASKGFKVFPVNKDKKPNMGFKWKEHATADLQTIEFLWNGSHKGAAIGIVTGKVSNLFVLDIDNKNGADGGESLKRLESQYGLLPETLTVQTPTGGKHYYFRYGDSNLTIDAGVWEGIDYRGEGGYVVAAGSVIASGTYQIVNDAPIADIPDWFPEALSRKKKALIKTGNLQTIDDLMKQGSRNNNLTSLAGSLRRKGFEEDIIKETLLSFNNHSSNPLPESEVVAIARSVARYEPSDLSFFTTEQDFSKELARRWEGKVIYVSGVGFLHNEQDIWIEDKEDLKVGRMIQDEVENACQIIEKEAENQRNKEDAEKVLKLRGKIKIRKFSEKLFEHAQSKPPVLKR